MGFDRKTCEGCSYHRPDPWFCSAPDGTPPTDGKCFPDWAEDRREAEAEEVYINCTREHITGG